MAVGPQGGVGGISIVIPAKDEAQNILELSGEINEAMALLENPWEVLWIDDGSQDHTLSVLKELNQRDRRHRYISFSTNCGQSAALIAGFHECTGEVIATLDADGQNDPRDLPPMISLLLSGKADMVNGYRAMRRDGFVRRISSKIANGFRNMTTGRTVRDVGCSTRVFKRECTAQLPPFKGLHRFFPTLIAMSGYRLQEVPVNHRSRRKGKTKYGIHNRLWVGLYDVFGIMWLRRRAFRYTIKERSET